MRRVLFRPQARDEFEAAGEWYERERSGLGGNFLQAVDEQLARIVANPLLYTAVYRDIRKGALRRFPYCIYFKLRGDAVAVLAVFHTARSPVTWKRHN